MSLLEPKVVDVSCEDGTEGQLTSEALATPANLSHHYLLVPAKLRLVTLAAFILSKCKVGCGTSVVMFCCCKWWGGHLYVMQLRWWWDTLLMGCDYARWVVAVQHHVIEFVTYV